jgi:hypothetical protein
MADGERRAHATILPIDTTAEAHILGRTMIPSPRFPFFRPGRVVGLLLSFSALLQLAFNEICLRAAPAPIEVGLAVRDITPEGPIWLAGYAARIRPADKIDTPLLAEAIAFRTRPGEPVILVSLDNCEVSHEFTAPVLQALAGQHHVAPGRVMIVSSHTHSGPVVVGPLLPMYHLSPADQTRVATYGSFLQRKLVEVVGAALTDLQPAALEQGVGRCSFAVNRRVFRDDKVVGGENLDGPVDWDVPVLRIKSTNNTLRAILFGYACHGTSIAGDDFYVVSGDYMAYARQQLESVYPGAVAAYLTAMGADSNPFPRGRLADARRHGLELAGAVASVLDRPMRPVSGELRFAYREVALPLDPPPTREQLESDAQSKDVYVQDRARKYLRMRSEGSKPPESVNLPLAALRIGNDLTFLAMGGEVVVDYARHFKRTLAADNPWVIGYAYEVPCYIPSIRILKEGGYEADSSLIYYGLYGPFQTGIENLLFRTMRELAGQVRNPIPFGD